MHNTLKHNGQGHSLTQHYQALLEAGELREDKEQKALVDELQRLQDAVTVYSDAKDRAGLVSRFMARFGRKIFHPPKGFYIFGDVGRGKSALMDMFYATTPVIRKKRLHFHDFMSDVQMRLQLVRAEHAGIKGDPIVTVAAEMAGDMDVLCFDEMQISDIADAMIVQRLFEQLLELGTVCVFTSNRLPKDLYKDGLNRQLFLPFITLLEQQFEIYSLTGPTDYRLKRLEGLRTYHTPVNEETTEALRAAFWAMTDLSPEDKERVEPTVLEVSGREIFVPKAVKGVAVFSFKRLCGNGRNPMGVPDYLAIARHFHTVFIVGIPQMGPHMRNEAKRFVTLIDALYESKVKLICSAEVEAHELYPLGDGRFEFDRTASRLMEMRSRDYLALGHGRDDSPQAAEF